jgi:hypothetical protein
MRGGCSSESRRRVIVRGEKEGWKAVEKDAAVLKRLAVDRPVIGTSGLKVNDRGRVAQCRAGDIWLHIAAGL